MEAAQCGMPWPRAAGKCVSAPLMPRCPRTATITLLTTCCPVDLPHIEETGASASGRSRTEPAVRCGGDLLRTAEQFSLYRNVLDARQPSASPARSTSAATRCCPIRATVRKTRQGRRGEVRRLDLSAPCAADPRAQPRAAEGVRRSRFPTIAGRLREEFDEAKALVERAAHDRACHGHKPAWTRPRRHSMVEVPSLLYLFDEPARAGRFSCPALSIWIALHARDRGQRQGGGSFDPLLAPTCARRAIAVRSSSSRVGDGARRAGVAVDRGAGAGGRWLPASDAGAVRGRSGRNHVARRRHRRRFLGPDPSRCSASPAAAGCRSASALMVSRPSWPQL